MLACCFAGYRPQGIADEEVNIKRSISNAVDKVIDDDVCKFFTAMEKGVDLWEAQVVLEKKVQNPDLQLVCVVPYKGVEEGWNFYWESIYKDVLTQADEVRTFHSKAISNGIREGSYWMVEHASHIIGVCHIHSKRTAAILEYAKRKDLKVIVIKE